MSPYQISHGTELMQNYRQSDVMGPDEKFVALQTNAGDALLFSISTNPKILYVTKETPGDANQKNGWVRRDLRGDQIKKAFPTGSCKDFAATQHVHESSATIQLALVVDDGANDHLYLSLGNSDTDTSWTDAPKWNACPFNVQGKQPPQPFKIASVFISEAPDGNRLVVDVLRDPNSPSPLISRYLIDISNPASPTWQAHDVDIQLQATNCKTCLGRRKPASHREETDPSDGMYTSGLVSGHSQFVYKPLKDPLGDPTSARLALTADASPPAPDAIAACRKPDRTSDLYAAHGGSLYYFASNKQFKDDVAVKVLESPLFIEVKQLFASVTKGIVSVWGRNGSNQIFYTTCPLPAPGTPPLSWSVPLPIMTEVQNVSPFVNRADTAQTFFAHTHDGEFKIAVKSPRVDGAWNVRDVHLPPKDVQQKAQSFRSYTTRVRVTGENNQLAANVDVVIKAADRTSMIINRLSYTVGPVPITVKTDAAGGITIVEEVSRVDGTTLTLSAGGSEKTIDPMKSSSTVLPRMEKLRTADGLKKAQIPNQKDKTTRPFVKGGASDDSVNGTATNVDNLLKARDHIEKKKNAVPSAAMPKEPSERYKNFVKGKTPIKVDGGDLLMHLESVTMRPAGPRLRAAMRGAGGTAMLGSGESWWDVIVEWFEEAWNFIVRIGEEIFQFVIELIEQVFEVFAYVLQKIVEWFEEEALDFFKWLFDVDNIVLTKQVMRNVIQRFLEEQIEQIQALKRKADDGFVQLEKELAGWAGLDWSKRVGEIGRAPPNSLTKPDEPAPNPADWLLGHAFADNAGDAVPVGDKPAAPKGLTDKLWTDIERWSDTLGDAKQKLLDLAKDAANIPLADTLKRLAGIIGQVVLETAKTAVDALFDILYEFAEAALNALCATVRIPVVSDILEEWGVPPFSILDVVCYVGAAPTTWIYNAVVRRPPFPKGPDTTFLIEAKDFRSIIDKLSGAKTLRTDSLLASTALAGGASGFSALALGFFAATRAFSGFVAIICIALGPLEAYQPSNIAVAPLTLAATSLTVIASGAQLIGTSVLYGSAPSPAHPDTREWAGASIAFSTLHLVTVLACCQPLWNVLVVGPQGVINRKVGAGIDAIVAIGQFVCECGHWHWLDQEADSIGKKLAVMGEVSNFFSGLARCARFATIMIPDEPEPNVPKWVAAGTMGVSQVVYAAMQWSEYGLAADAE